MREYKKVKKTVKEMKKFVKSVGMIAVPVALQSMLQSSFSIIDQLMIGQLGKNSIAAVGVGSNFMLIFSVVIGAIGAVAGIIISQFIGAEDEEEAWRGFTTSTLLGLVVAGVFMLICLQFSQLIIGLYTTDPITIYEGGPYLKLLAYTFIPIVLSTIMATWLRCNEHAIIPLIASIAAVACNTGLNYIFIFGKLGFEAYGIKGAGYATVVSQLANFLLMTIGFFYCNRKENRRIFLSVRMQKIAFNEYVSMIFPLLISEVLWSLGQNINSAVYGHLNTDSLAAYTLTTPIQGLIIGALSGLSAASGVIIGKKLGAKNYGEAYNDSKKLMFIGLLGSMFLATILIIFSKAYVSVYMVENEVKKIARTLLIVFAMYSPVKVLNMILGGGIIRSGGNTKIIMIIDIIGTWLVGIPLCLVSVYVWRLSIVPAYGILSFEEVVRLAMTLIVFRKKEWMKSLG